MYRGFSGGSVVKNANAWDWIQSLGQEDPLEKEMAIHSSIIAWEIPMGLQRVRHNLETKQQNSINV